ncbi:hypothetical protein HYQ44_007878 [Verticillium longisporum]|nr:hypothetical protein HYQ44_007878 [Verticillium longisporum]
MPPGSPSPPLLRLLLGSVLAYAPLVSGDLMLSTVGTTSFGSILDGQLMGRVQAHFIFKRNTGLGALTKSLVEEGAEIGLTLRPTLADTYASSRSEDRVVTTGLRKFGRTLGGASGLVVSGAILSNALSRDLTQGGYMDEKEVASLTISMYAPGVGLHHISIFYMYAVCAALALALTAGAGHASLKVKALPAEQPKTLEASGDDEVGRMNRAEMGGAEGQG